MLQGLPGHQGNANVQAVNGIAWGETAVALLLSCEAQELGWLGNRVCQSQKALKGCGWAGARLGDTHTQAP